MNHLKKKIKIKKFMELPLSRYRVLTNFVINASAVATIAVFVVLYQATISINRNENPPK
jgi:hypothetical protein